MKIQIDGLNDKQVQMLDKLWTCDTTDDVLEWMNTLSKEDFFMAVTLQEMILDEMITTNLTWIALPSLCYSFQWLHGPQATLYQSCFYIHM